MSADAQRANPPRSPSIAGVVRDAWAGSLPERYAEPRTSVPFARAVRAQLRPGQRILDVGSGSLPFLAPEDLPEGAHYAGTDISGDELAKAPRGWYHASYVSDVTRRSDELVGSYDLVISNQVLEHVKPLDAAMENMRAYLAPGGTMVAKFSGTFSIFGLINRMVPHKLAVWGLHRFLGYDPEHIFPAHYDHCWDSALRRMLAPWSEVRIDPLYMGAEYLSFVRPLQGLYVGAEEIWARRDVRNLAAYYIVTAKR